MTKKRRSRKSTVSTRGGPTHPAKPAATGADMHLAGGRVLLAVAIMVAAGVLAYANSFRGVLVFDDIQAVTQNPNIESILPLSRSMSAPPDTTVSGRPMVSLSLAVNYAISRRDLWSYHAFNLAVHLLAGLTLFGVIRRTLLTERLKARFADASWALALICATIWLVHPVQTQAVTYIVQRAESMMGLFYLLTLYCAIRSTHSRWPGGWQLASIVCCAAGMGTKEVMATAPLMVLIYHRVFIARSFREIFAKRWAFYTALAGTWVILAMLVLSGPRSGSAGFELGVYTARSYAQAQCGAILHYIRLAFWPHPLILDYARRTAESFSQYGPQGLVVLALLGATVTALRLRPEVGFLGVWFFLILAPTSSFVPIADPIFEHRMYLSLAAIVAGVVLCTYYLLSRLLAPRRSLRVGVGLALAGTVVVLLSLLTARRNYDYRSEIAIWTDTVTKQPESSRAHLQLGGAYGKAGEPTQAMSHYNESIRIDSNYAKAYVNRGIAHAKASVNQSIAHVKDRRLGLAIADLDKAISLKKNYYLAHANRAITYMHLEDYDRAIQDFDIAIRLNPTNQWVRQGRDEAIALKRAADSGRLQKQ